MLYNYLLYWLQSDNFFELVVQREITGRNDHVIAYALEVMVNVISQENEALQEKQN